MFFMNYSLIVPLFNEQDHIENLNKEILSITNQLTKDNRKFEIIYIDDCSKDETFLKIKEISDKEETVTAARNKWNLGQSGAIFNGIQISSNENVILLDGDGQNDPADINKMIEEFEKGYDLVHGYRDKRKDPYLTKTIPSKFANLLVRFFSKSKIIDHGCSLKIIKKKYLMSDIYWGDFHRLLAARLSNIDLKILQIETNHRERRFGKSNYGYSRVWRILIDLVYLYLFQNAKNNNFYVIGFAGLLSLLFGFCSIIFMFWLKIFKGISFIQTPLPILIVFSILSSLIFFSIMFISQLLFEIKNKLKSSLDNEFEVIKKN